MYNFFELKPQEKNRSNSSRNYLSIIAEANIDFDSDDDMILHKHDITYFFKRIKKTCAFLWRLINSTFKQYSLMLRYLNFKPSFKLPWCRTQDLFGSQIPVTTGGFQLQISCIGSSYLTHWATRPNRLSRFRVPKFVTLQQE